MEKTEKTLSVPRSHLFSNSPDCPSYNPHDISLENLVLDQLTIR